MSLKELNEEQLSFIEPIEKPIEQPIRKYGPTICSRCCCNECKLSVEIYPFLSKEECKEVKEGCFNCDECYYYGMDNESLSRNKIKFQCDKFEISNYYAEREVQRRRKSFKIVKEV